MMAISVGGCSGPLSIVQTAAPSPFGGATRCVVEPFSYEPNYIVGKTEAGYLEKQSEESRAAFPSDKSTMEKSVLLALGERLGENGLTVEQGPAKEGDLVVRPTIFFLEPGFWGGTQQAVLKLRVEISRSGSKGADIVEIKATSEKKAGFVSVAVDAQSRDSRMAEAGRNGGYLLADHLVSRVKQP